MARHDWQRSADRLVALFLSSGKKLRVCTGKTPLSAICLSNDNKYILTGGDDKCPRIWVWQGSRVLVVIAGLKHCASSETASTTTPGLRLGLSGILVCTYPRKHHTVCHLSNTDGHACIMDIFVVGRAPLPVRALGAPSARALHSPSHAPVDKSTQTNFAITFEDNSTVKKNPSGETPLQLTRRHVLGSRS